MNDFERDITGMSGVVKQIGFYKTNAQEKMRTVTVESGPGCLPDVGTSRKIKVKWLSDGLHDNLSSYDLEFVLTAAGKKVYQTEVEFTEVDRAVAPGDIKPKLVRRKAQ